MTESTDFDQVQQPNLTRRDFARGMIAAAAAATVVPALAADPEPAKPFGDEFPNLDSFAVGEWWTKKPAKNAPNPPPPTDIIPWPITASVSGSPWCGLPPTAVSGRSSWPP